MNNYLSRYRYFSWKVFWEMIFSPFKTVNKLMEQEKDLDKIHHGTKSFSINGFIYLRKDLYETDLYKIDPFPIVYIYNEMKPKEKTFVRSTNLLAMWKAIKSSVEKSNG